MAKLWSAWDSQESFEENCQKNGIIWGVTKYAPKQDKEVNTANYQFLQTLNLTPEMVKDVCKPTVDYIQGVSYDNIYYTLLFLLGENLTQDNIENYMKSSDNYWLKSLVLNNSLLYDKYSKEKVFHSLLAQYYFQKDMFEEAFKEIELLKETTGLP